MSTLDTLPAPRRRRFTRFGIAALAAAAVALSGLGAAPAFAAPGAVLVTGGPTLNVSPTSSVGVGTVLTITGSGYDATTISPSTGQVAGFYLSVGSVDTTNGWRPSLSKPSSSRVETQTIWVHPGGTGTGQANLTASGTFSTTITVATQYTKPSGYTSAVFTIGAHGVANAAQEQGREIGYTGAYTAPPATGTGTPALAVTKNTATSTYYVSGSGYGGATAVGVYASIGVIDTTNGWQPSAGKPTSSRVASDTLWVWSGGPSTPAGGQAKLTSGAFAVSLSYASLPALPAGFSYAIYTVGAHGSANAAVEKAVLITP
ncbi:hypothetical protein [Herbiconiux sp.]|uniref:hypothetical protein n=1 Tax=Herbiconiux sp. TaxID=1871186 RepID=UPI0025BEB0E8|nr:hypothetical protein [Herbiconiux sp.]